MKRIYKTVTVEAADDGFMVTLDGRALRSPARRALALPTRALADAVAEEWDAQGDTVEPATMTMMSFASTVADRVVPQRDHVVDEIAAYGGSDLLCFLAEGPEALVERQQAGWTPWRRWAEARFQVTFTVTSGIMPVRQADATLVALKAAVEAVGNWHLAPLHTATTITGSLVLGLAMHAEAVSADEAFDLSQIDEAYQVEQWGLDREAEQRRRALREEMRGAARFADLVGR